MSMIKVNCPSCKSPLQIAEQKLRETQGRVVCHECQHIFRLVKKNKKAAEKRVPPPAPDNGFSPLDRARGDKPVFNDVGVQNSDPVWPTDGWPNASDVPPPKVQAAASKKKAAHKPQKQRLNYRVPKAGDKPAFADVREEEKPFAFNLLDSQAAKMQVPQVSINPDPTQLAQQALQRNGSDQQNNITIHTGSLVFTVMGDSQGGTTLTAPDGGKFAEPAVSGVPVAALPAPAQTHSELNWSIAAMSALVVLIVQLVYLMMQFLH